MLSRRHFVGSLLSAAGLAPFAASAVAVEETVEIGGKIGGVSPRELTLSEIRSLPAGVIVTHTPWHSGAVKFEGVLGQELMKYLGATGQTLKIAALDGYAINVPIEDFAKYNSILAYRINDSDLTVETKGPLFLVYPFDSRPETANETFYARCIWQIAKIDIE